MTIFNSYYLDGLKPDTATMVKALAVHHFQVYRGDKGLISEPNAMRLALRHVKGDLAILALGEVFLNLLGEVDYNEEILRKTALGILSSLRASVGIFRV